MRPDPSRTALLPPPVVPLPKAVQFRHAPGLLAGVPEECAARRGGASSSCSCDTVLAGDCCSPIAKHHGALLGASVFRSRGRSSRPRTTSTLTATVIRAPNSLGRFAVLQRHGRVDADGHAHSLTPIRSGDDHRARRDRLAWLSAKGIAANRPPRTSGPARKDCCGHDLRPLTTRRSSRKYARLAAGITRFAGVVASRGLLLFECERTLAFNGEETSGRPA